MNDKKRPSELKVGDIVKGGANIATNPYVAVIKIIPDDLYLDITCNRIYFSDGSGWSFTETIDNTPMWEVIDVAALVAQNDRLWEYRDPALQDVVSNANDNRHKHPNMRTLSEEYAEAILSERGKHEHPLRLELVQIAGVCINMIRQIDAGQEFKK